MKRLAFPAELIAAFFGGGLLAHALHWLGLA